MKNYKFRDKCSEIKSTTYLTHGIHSYTAKFIPHMPSYFIRKYANLGDTVLDPFCGSGTTLVEAKINGINSFGIDINPLARMITRVKTTPINPKTMDLVIRKLKILLEKNLKLEYDVDFPNKFYWFDKKSAYELRKIRTAIKILKDNQEINRNIENFFLVCFSSIIRASSYADPKNPKTYCSPRMRELRKNGVIKHPLKYFYNTLEKYNNNMNLFYDKLNELGKKPFSRVMHYGDATNISLPKGKNPVDLIVTSPPYANAQEYFRNIKLELFWLGYSREKIINLDKRQIGGENHAVLHYKNLQFTGYNEIDPIIKKIFKINKKSSYIVYKYFINMEKTLKNCHRVLKKNKHMVIIVGNNTVRGIEIPINKVLTKMALNNGFKLHSVGFDEIKSRTFMLKRNNDAPPITKDWVIDLVKK